ncbi:MAG: NTP transferase domain-containing protein, partial [Deltaproteobacteria bacterium]|nr:NTP transferase domain-containing protein [Deltaproteobacteria bacterium]
MVLAHSPEDLKMCPPPLAPVAVQAMVLAAGRSERFAPGHKALPLPEGGGLLARSLGNLSLAGLKTLVVVGHRAPEVTAEATAYGASTIFNSNYDLGMFSSVLTGLVEISLRSPRDCVLVLPVDAAFVRGASYIKLISFWLDLGEERKQVAVIPEYQGKLGHPPLLGPGPVRRVINYSESDGLKGALASFAGNITEANEIKEGYRPFDGPMGCSKLRYISIEDSFLLCDIDQKEDLEVALSKKSPKPSKLTLREAITLLRLVGPPRKMAHAVTVATIALRLAIALGASEPELAFVGGLLHDLDHGPNRHDLRAASRLWDLGFDEL